MLHAFALACFAAGIAVVVLSSAAALVLWQVLGRLHFLSPATSLGVPLVGLGLAVENGWSLTTAEILFICLLLAGTGPVLASATGRMAAQRQGATSRETPE